jgi:hypothetical protein
MAKFNMSNAKSFSSNGGGNSFFTLKDDKETAKVRFLLKDEDDLEIYSVHKMEGMKQIDCLGKNCPLCKSGDRPKLRIYIPLSVEGEAKVWERGSNYIAKIEALFRRYGTKNDLFKQEFEIERNGKKGDKETTYEIFPIDKDNKLSFEDLPNSVSVLGKIVAEMDINEMNEYLKGNVAEKPIAKEKAEKPTSKVKSIVLDEDDDDLPF